MKNSAPGGKTAGRVACAQGSIMLRLLLGVGRRRRFQICVPVSVSTMPACIMMP